MDNVQTTSQLADQALEGVEYAINHATSQTNKQLLPRIREIVMEIKNRNYANVDELLIMIWGGVSEGSGPDTDIFQMNVNAGGKSYCLGVLLDDLVNSVS